MAKPEVTEERLRRLIDEEAVKQIMFRYAECVDGKMWDEWAALFTEDACFEMPFGRIEGRSNLAEFAGNSLASFDITHHCITNQQVVIDGDTATSRQNITAVHTPSKDDISVHFDEGGHYFLSLVRTDEGWKIKSLAGNLHWTSGKDDAGISG